MHGLAGSSDRFHPPRRHRCNQPQHPQVSAHIITPPFKGFRGQDSSKEWEGGSGRQLRAGGRTPWPLCAPFPPPSYQTELGGFCLSEMKPMWIGHRVLVAPRPFGTIDERGWGFKPRTPSKCLDVALHAGEFETPKKGDDQRRERRRTSHSQVVELIARSVF